MKSNFTKVQMMKLSSKMKLTNAIHRSLRLQLLPPQLLQQPPFSVFRFLYATSWPISIRKRCRESWVLWVPYAIQEIQLHDIRSIHGLSSRGHHQVQCCRTATFAWLSAFDVLVSAGQRKSQQTSVDRRTDAR